MYVIEDQWELRGELHAPVVLVKFYTRLRGSIRHASEHIGVTETALRSAFNNKTPMFSGTNGKTYSRNVPHLYRATIREATPSEIATHTWTILERIVTR